MRSYRNLAQGLNVIFLIWGECGVNSHTKVNKTPGNNIFFPHGLLLQVQVRDPAPLGNKSVAQTPVVFCRSVPDAFPSLSASQAAQDAQLTVN